MDLSEAVLCIDCDNVFAIEGSPTNPRCPRCASSVLMPLSAWVRTWTAFERGTEEEERVARDDTAERRRKIALVHSIPAAA